MLNGICVREYLVSNSIRDKVEDFQKKVFLFTGFVVFLFSLFRTGALSFWDERVQICTSLIRAEGVTH